MDAAATNQEKVSIDVISISGGDPCDPALLDEFSRRADQVNRRHAESFVQLDELSKFLLQKRIGTKFLWFLTWK